MAVRLRCVRCGRYDSAVRGQFVDVNSIPAFVCHKCLCYYV